MAEHRRSRLPRLFLVPLQALEVENALRQQAFHQRRSPPADERALALARPMGNGKRGRGNNAVQGVEWRACLQALPA